MTMKKFKYLLILASIIFSVNSVFAADMIGVKLKKKLAGLDSQYKEVVKSGFAWTKTSSLLSKAKKALSKGKNDDAKKLMGKASAQMKDSLAQASLADKHWQDYIVK
jgi:hypothetical protein